MITRRPIIGVMGSHENEWEEFSSSLGKMIAQHDYHLLTGAGGGVMTAVSKSFTQETNRKGSNIGIIPTIDYDGGYLSREEYPNPYIEIPVFTQLGNKEQSDMMPYSRNCVNVMSSNALVILPGSHGTRNEVSLAIQYNKPMILFGPDDAFEKFPDQPTRVDTIEEVQEFLEQACAKIRTAEENLD